MAHRGYNERMRQTLITLCLLALTGVSLWWLAHPPRTVQDYRERSAEIAESLRSNVATARLWTREVGGDRALRPTAAVALEEASAGAQSTSSTFDSWVPPRGLDALRRTVADVAGAASDALGSVRTDAERGDWNAVAAAQASLRRLERRLARVASEARP
jgi:hypothetical protein